MSWKCIKWLLPFFFIFVAQQSIGQPLNGKIIVTTNFPGDPDSLVLEVFSEAARKNLFIKPISAHSTSKFIINGTESDWLTVYVKQNGKPKAGAGRFYIKGKENIKVRMSAFFAKAEITGGENVFIEDNRYLLFDPPSSIGKSKEFNTANLRKAKTFKPNDGNLAVRMEEFLNSSARSIERYNDFDYTLAALWSKRQYFPLDFLDSSKSFFSARIQKTKKWQEFDDYIRKELNIMQDIVNDSISVIDRQERASKLLQLYSDYEFTFIDFWASWCIPCIQEFPQLKELYAKSDQGRIGFVSVSIDKNKEEWQNSDKKQEFPWPSYWDINGEVENQFDVRYIPQGVILDKTGKAIQRFVTIEQLVEFLKSKKII